MQVCIDHSIPDEGFSSVHSTCPSQITPRGAPVHYDYTCQHHSSACASALQQYLSASPLVVRQYISTILVSITPRGAPVRNDNTCQHHSSWCASTLRQYLSASLLVVRQYITTILVSITPRGAPVHNDNTCQHHSSWCASTLRQYLSASLLGVRQYITTDRQLNGNALMMSTESQYFQYTSALEGENLYNLDECIQGFP
jgi:hypothetical protein